MKPSPTRRSVGAGAAAREVAKEIAATRVARVEERVPVMSPAV
jgi:hypothetical protein